VRDHRFPRALLILALQQIVLVTGVFHHSHWSHPAVAKFGGVLAPRRVVHPHVIPYSERPRLPLDTVVVPGLTGLVLPPGALSALTTSLHRP
jgi:hypothetical protein